jgi:hypothetical protein
MPVLNGHPGVSGDGVLPGARSFARDDHPAAFEQEVAMTTRLRMRDEIAWVDGIGGRVVVLDLDRLSEPPRLLVEPGAAIWRAVNGLRDQEEIVLAVAAAYPMAPEQIRDDVRRFLTELGLVVASDQRP